MEEQVEYSNDLPKYSTDYDISVLEENANKKNFYDYMKKNGLDFDDVDDVSKLPKFIVEMSKNIDTFNHFNNVLYTLNKENKINIVDSMIILVTDYLEPNQVKKLLDEMNFYLLTNELKKRYKIGKIMIEQSTDPQYLFIFFRLQISF